MTSNNQFVKNRIILGLMTFGPDKEEGTRITELAEFERCLDYFQSRSYDEVDTARVYAGGKQETFTAEAHWKERGLKLATKVFPVKPGDHEPEALTQIFRTSCESLGTQQVDILYLHAPDRGVPFARTLKAVDDLYRSGKFLQLGLSNFAAFEVAEVVMTCQANGWVRPTIYQAMYNVITRSIEAELIPACRRYGIEVVVYNPLAGGLLSGKYSLAALPTEGRFSGDSTEQGNQYRARYFRDDYFEALSLIEPVAQKHGLTLVQIAFRWLLHHSMLDTATRNGGNDGIIIGASSIGQLQANLSHAQEGRLPSEILVVLDKAWRICRGDSPDYWQGRPLEYSYDVQKSLFGA